MRSSLVAICLAALIAAAGAAYAGMRCGTRLVSAGDHAVKVRALCGEPDSVRHRVAYEVLKARRHGLHHHAALEIPIEVEQWIYNLGPHRFMRCLTFVDGELVQVDTLDYGY